MKKVLIVLTIVAASIAAIAPVAGAFGKIVVTCYGADGFPCP